MKRGFIESVLFTQKRRQLFYWVRNLVAFIAAVSVFHEVGGGLGAGLAVLALFVAYYTVAPVVAFAACLFEQMYS